MIVLLERNITDNQKELLINFLKKMDLKMHFSDKDGQILIGLTGDLKRVDENLLETLDGIESITRISDPFKRTNKKFQEEASVINIGDLKIGGGNFQIIAGPCSVECEEQIVKVAESIKQSGAGLLRGGAFKPRSSPYDFQGLHGEGLKLLEKANEKTKLPIVTEIMNIVDLELFKDVDVIQVGARNMQNFDLLKALGKLNKPILLKRGLANTIKELLLSAEYIMSEGNQNVILCERGIRTFEPYTRNTLDLSAIPVIRKHSHLPIIIDPSHATGVASYVESMSLAAVAAGADGLMIEVHNDPKNALSDGAQSLDLEQFEKLSKKIYKLRETMEEINTY